MSSASTELRHGGVVIITNAILVAFGIVAIGMFFTRRHVQPIKSRHPKLVMWTALCTLLWAALTAIDREMPHNSPCWLAMVRAHLLLPMNFVLYFVRSVVFLANYQHVQVLLEQHRASAEKGTKQQYKAAPDQVSFLAMNKKQNQWKLIGALTTLHIVIVSALLASSSSIRNEMVPECEIPGVSRILVIVVVLGYSSCLFAVSRKLKVVVENLGWKVELKAVAFAASLNAVVWFGPGAVPALKDFLEVQTPITPLYMQFTAAVVFSASVVYPVVRSYELEKEKKHMAEVDPDGCDLQEFLDTKNGNAAFYDFLALEFSLENLLFYEEARKFKTLALKHKEWVGARNLAQLKKKGIVARQVKLYNRALHIFQSFVAVDAPDEVNLPSGVGARIAEHLKVPKTGIPDDFFKQNTTKPTAAGTAADVEQPAESPRDTAGVGSSFDPNSFSTMASSSSKYARGNSISTFGNFVDAGGIGNVDVNFEEMEAVFREAHDEVYKLMSKDSFNRFKATKEYEAVIEEMKDNKAANAAMIEMDLV